MRGEATSAGAPLSARLRIAVVEDDEDLAFTLVYNLKKDGRYEIERFAGGLVALDELLVRPPDLIVLDLNLPDVDGLTICRELKKHEETRRVPIIMLTARVEERDKLLGFELGADDYVVKPFSMRELILRIAAVLARAELRDVRAIEVADLRIDRDAHRVTVGGEPVSLSPLEFKLLVTLTQRRDLVQARSVLLDEVCAIDSEARSRTIDTHVKRLRYKLGRAGRFIETVRGVGYRFTETPSTQNGASRSTS